MTQPVQKHLTFAIGRPLTSTEATQLAQESPVGVQMAADAIAKEAGALERLHAAQMADSLSTLAPSSILGRLEALSTPVKAALGAGVALVTLMALKGKK